MFRFVYSASSSLAAPFPAVLVKPSFLLPAVRDVCECNFDFQRRFKATFIRVANRKKVEMFVGKRFHLPTRLRTAAPEIAAEWDYEKNPMHLYPDIVGIGHVSPVWWKCSVCEQSFSMSVEKRVVRGGGCPACAGDKPTALRQEKVKSGEEENVLDGERDPVMRPKRPVMFNLRTKY